MKTHGKQALAKNVLQLHADKFQSLNINPRKLDKDYSYTALKINDIEIPKATQIKLLGVHINENLDFTKHICELCRASQEIGLFLAYAI